MTAPVRRPYEFDDAQNATFASLARAMKFVAVAMLLVSGIIGVGAVLLARSTLAGAAILAPLAIAVAIMAAQLYAAARRFRRIVLTQGRDISNLMVALDEMAIAYGVQRWLWVTVSIVILLALLTTTVGH